MRIVFDGLPLCEPKTGIGHYTFELALAMAKRRIRDECQFVAPAPIVPGVLEVPDGELPRNLSFQRVVPGMIQRNWFTIGLSTFLKHTRTDVFHGTNYEIPFRPVCPTVVTFHDLSLFLFSQTHEKERVARARRRFPIVARIADMIVTPTEQIRREVLDVFNLRGDKVVAIPEAPREIFKPATQDEIGAVKREHGIEGPYILAVGTLEPRKNFITLVRAFESLLRDTDLRPQLVVTGRKGWLNDSLFSEIDKLKIADRLVLTGYLSDRKLSALYSGCGAFVYPSLYEGFGLPPLEAMACGAPVIASSIGTLREVLGECARFAEAESVADLEKALNEILTLPETERRRQYTEPGFEHAAKYSWQSAAEKTREVYVEALRRFRASKLRRLVATF
jgi:glycosyltransferase involved in cell wall biosynthesis